MSGTIKIVSRHFSETQSLIKHWNVFFLLLRGIRLLKMTQYRAVSCGNGPQAADMHQSI